MATAIEHIVVGASDPGRLARWWQQVLGWVLVHDGELGAVIRCPQGPAPGLRFVPLEPDDVGCAVVGLELRSDEPAAELARLVELGAVQKDALTPDAAAVTLADPEGNRFTLLNTRGLAPDARPPAAVDRAGMSYAARAYRERLTDQASWRRNRR